MMLRIAVVPVLALSFAACNSSSGGGGLPADIAQKLQLLEPCAKDQAGNLFGALDSISALLAAFQDPTSPPVEIVFAPTGNPGEFSFEIPLDADGDGTPDGNLTGTARLTGLGGVGTTAEVDWMLGLGTVTGSGVFDFELTGPTTVEMHGSGQLDDSASGCSMTLLVDAAAPLLFDLTADCLGIQGNVRISVLSGEDDLSADVVVTIGAAELRFENVSVNGTSVPRFSVATSCVPRQPPPGGGGDFLGYWVFQVSCSGEPTTVTIDFEHVMEGSGDGFANSLDFTEVPFVAEIVGNQAFLTLSWTEGEASYFADVTLTLREDGTAGFQAEVYLGEALDDVCTGTGENFGVQ